VTALVLGLALLVWIAPPAVSEALIYDRAAILHGAVWRLWSGHLVHFSASHLGWNLLVVGLAGAWIECAGFRGGRALWMIVPPCIGLALLAGDPTLSRYGGLSGLATAIVVFACLSECRFRPGRIIWGVALALVGLKIGWEFFAGNPVFAHFEHGTVRAVPLSHLAGLVSAFVLWLIVSDNKPAATISSVG